MNASKIKMKITYRKWVTPLFVLWMLCVKHFGFKPWPAKWMINVELSHD